MYILLVYADIRCYVEKLPKTMVSRDGLRGGREGEGEREREGEREKESV